MAVDHVIIGSGINGLVAASLLALKGDRLLVLERESVPGGCMRTEELTPGFLHDAMAATFVLFMTSPAGAALGPHLARHGFEYCYTPHPTAVLRPGGEAAVLTMDRATNLGALIAEKGGQVRCGEDVERILVHNGRVSGVRVVGGEEIPTKSLLASVAPGQLYSRLLDGVNLPQDRAAAKTFRQGRGNFHVHFALDAVPEWQTPGLDQVGLILLTDGVDALSKSSNEAERGLLPVTPTICVGQPCKLDPSCAPDGKAVLWLQIPDTPRVIKGDAAGLIQGIDWDDVREAFANRLQAIPSRHIKDFDQLVLSRRAYSPKDLERMNINLVGGRHCGVEQFFLWPPFTHSKSGTGPVRGRVHIGARTHPGFGLGGGSSFNAAKRLGA